MAVVAPHFPDLPPFDPSQWPYESSSASSFMPLSEDNGQYNHHAHYHHAGSDPSLVGGQHAPFTGMSTIIHHMTDSQPPLPEALAMSAASHSASSLPMGITNSVPTPTLGAHPTLPQQEHSAEALSSKRRAPGRKKQPQRSEFSSEEEFQTAWSRWKASRDKNNASVKRSREKAKEKSAMHKHLMKLREQEKARLESEAAALRKNVELLVKAISKPRALSSLEQAWVQALVHSDASHELASQVAPFQ